jgi:hypothetical protein
MKTIEVNKEKFVSEKDYNELLKKKAGKTVVNGKEIPFVVGGKYFIRTVTYFATGEVESIKGDFLCLKDAAWIADTGRFSTALSTGVLNEVEPVEEMFLNMISITDAFPWKFDLPRILK